MHARYIQAVFDHAGAMHPSERPHWIISSSEEVFVLARDRVYELQRTQHVLIGAKVPVGEHRKAAFAAARMPGGRGRTDRAPAGAVCVAKSAKKRHRNASLRRCTTAGTCSAAGSPTISVGEATIARDHCGSQSPPLSVRCVLEEPAKWRVLRSVLDEVDGLRCAPGCRGCTLIIVRDERTGATLRQLLKQGARPALEATFTRWVGRRRAYGPSVAVASARQYETRLLQATAGKLRAQHAVASRPPSALHRAAVESGRSTHRQDVASGTGVVDGGTRLTPEVGLTESSVRHASLCFIACSKLHDFPACAVPSRPASNAHRCVRNCP